MAEGCYGGGIGRGRTLARRRAFNQYLAMIYVGLVEKYLVTLFVNTA